MKYLIEPILYLSIILTMPIVFVYASIVAIVNVGKFVIMDYPAMFYATIKHRISGE